MRYVFAKDNTKLKVTLEAGALMLVFPADEQALAYRVIMGIMQLLETHKLDELAQMLRTEHDKKEEN